jgi:NADPH:quinone reductase-like Zn-dependent oxidoreductase
VPRLQRRQPAEDTSSAVRVASSDAEPRLRAATNELGFDLVLNTIAGEALVANFSLLAPHGRHLELGKRDIVEDHALPLGGFTDNRSFQAVDIWQLAKHEQDRAGRVMAAVRQLVTDGVLRPLPHYEYRAADAAEAFRALRESRHVGKIVLAFPTDSDPAVDTASPACPTTSHRR